MLFDLLAGVVIALATVSIGVMAAFALVFVPPLVAYRFGRSWRFGLGLAAAVGMAGYSLAFALSLAFDQPFGPVCALLLVVIILALGVKSDRL